jgi:hypothetical protein
MAPPDPRRLESRHRPFADYLPLELRQLAAYVEDEPPARGSGIQRLFQAPKAHAPALELSHQVD